MDEILDHRKNDEALSKDDAFITDANGNKRRIPTTKGHELKYRWKDGTTSWVSLRDAKDSNPVEVAEYAVANKISDEPAYAWWVRHTLRKRDALIKKVKSRYWKRTHKYGIELPHSVEEALRIDQRTGTTYWRDAIAKEMENVQPAFEFRDDDKIPPGYKKASGHMVFDVKIDFGRKARWVGDGHKTDPPKESVYSSVVSRDSVRIALTIAALNDLDVLAADVQNAYLNAPTKEKLYIPKCGPEFGKNAGRPCIIVRALYGLKSLGARWHDHLANTLHTMGYQSCLADPDVWMKARVKPSGEEYWEYVLAYVDDILVISHEPRKVMDKLQAAYQLKNNSVAKPTQYLGADVMEHTIEGSEDPHKPRWAMSSDTYVNRAIADVENELTQNGDKLVKQTTPLSSGYRPELDSTPLLDERRASYFQGLIGVLRWIVELGQVDVLTPAAMLSSYLAAPRQGHLEQALHIFGYLKKYNHSKMVFDDTYPMFDESRFQRCDWSEFYPGASDPLPPRMPQPRGKVVSTTCFVDADHAGCQVTRRSFTGIILFVNRAPITWFSKRQNTVETSTFGSEFVALKTAVEMIEGLRYKLRMMGIPLDGPTSVFCDNESVVKNSTRPESTLKKRHNAIAYHRSREAQAADIVRIAFIDGKDNIADLFTKLLPGPRLRELIKMVLW